MQKVTLGILAHVDSGKTTLSEGLLYASGALRKLGRVDHGHAAGGGAHAAGPPGIREDRLCGLVEASAVAVRFADDGGRARVFKH